MIQIYYTLLFFICFFQSFIQAELLIVVKDKTNSNFRVMTHEETIQYQNKINEVLLKYQWPMCIQSDLTPTEIAEYLSPDKPYAQEQFIQKKLQEIIDPSEIDLNVMFIPDSFYQLYCIAEQSYNAFHEQYEMAQKAGNMHVKRSYLQPKKPIDPLSNNRTEARTALKNSFSDINQLFFQSIKNESPSCLMNNQLVQYIFDAYPELCTQKSILDVSNALEPKIETLKGTICQTMAQNNTYKKTITPNLIYHDTFSWFKREPETQIISTVIKYEYEARKLNKAFILRGTNIVGETNEFKHAQNEQKLILAGSTVREPRSFKNSLFGTQENPYSISYANSLFAGFYQDPLGCAYVYLNEIASKHTSLNIIGYGLFIDQQAYIKDNNKGLFYIPSLAPLTSLFEKGQYCHPRSRVAVPDKSKINKVEGLVRTNEQGLIDPADIIIFQDDPIKHEEKFSTFLVKNGRLINAQYNTNNQTLEENSRSKIIDSHKTIAQMHQQVRVLGKKLLRRLMRAGSQTIPGFSELELNEILENGATAQEYVMLQKALSSMQLEPITRQILQMSAQDLHETIVSNRHKKLLNETLHLPTTNDSVKTAIKQTITIWNKNPLFLKENIVQILKVLNYWVDKVDHLEQKIIIENLTTWFNNGLITADNVNELWPIIGSSIINVNREINDLGFNFLLQLISNIALNEDQTDHFLQMIINLSTSTNPRVGIIIRFAIRLLIYPEPWSKFTLNTKKIDLLIPVLFKLEKNAHLKLLPFFEDLIDSYSKLLTHEQINQILKWMANIPNEKNIDQSSNKEAHTRALLSKSRLLELMSMAKYNLTIDQMDKIIPIIDECIKSDDMRVLRNILFSINFLASKQLFKQKNASLLTKWIDDSILIIKNSIPTTDDNLYYKTDLYEIINSLIQDKILSSNNLSTLLDKHQNFWSQAETVELQKKVDQLKIQETEHIQASLNIRAPTDSTSKQSMLDFALHGARKVPTKYPIDMRVNPKIDQSEFVPPSAKTLKAQRTQMEKFKRGYNQKDSIQTAKIQRQYQQLKSQDKALEQAQAAKLNDLTRSLATAGSKLRRLRPVMIR